MWDWIRSNGTELYDTFWNIRAQKEYEFIYKKSFAQELIDRDILSYYDMILFWNIKIGRSVHHFAHPWNNESTDAGLLRMRLEEFDELHPVVKKKNETFRKKKKNLIVLFIVSMKLLKNLILIFGKVEVKIDSPLL